MTDERFDYTNYDDGTESIYDRKEDKYYFDCEFCRLDELLNELADENEQLKEQNKELKQNNDIKFWKLECLQSSNNNQMMLFELSRAIQQGYKVSDKFKQYLNEIKAHDKEIREKHKRLFE